MTTNLKPNQIMDDDRQFHIEGDRFYLDTEGTIHLSMMQTIEAGGELVDHIRTLTALHPALRRDAELMRLLGQFHKAVCTTSRAIDGGPAPTGGGGLGLWPLGGDRRVGLRARYDLIGDFEKWAK